MTSSSSSGFHLLKGADGSIDVPIHTETSWFLIGLENRAITASLTTAGTISVTPSSSLSDHDRLTIKRLRKHIITALRYRAPEGTR